ncbi:unnamed protein product [Cladocopium goreaui]|uniref:MYND-type domain-containing protein n=1 Tax=Cladocopium goreaui TaxID=2562237 RepID=A0A9P1GKU5_9DINO|nr:unnamed protein product [Cladocopium goreaui]
MPNAELSDRQCDHCGVLGALLQCGSCKQVAYCNFKCQRVAWKEHKRRCGLPAPPAPAPVPSWAEHQAAGARGQLPRPKMGIQGAQPAKIEDFFDRDDLDCGLAPLRDKKTETTSSRRPSGREDRLNYSKWDNLADSDEDSKDSKLRRAPKPGTTPAQSAASAKPPLFGQAMGMAPARQATKPDTRTAAEKREEAEKLLHQVAGEVLYQAGFMGHGSVWELGPAAEKVARKCLRLLDSKVLPVLPNDQLAKFLHGSANFFLRRTMSCSDAEKHSFAAEAKALLLEVYRDHELSEEYRENACDFLAALLHEEGKPQQAEDVLKGLNLNSKENVPVTDAVSGVSNGSGPNGAQKYKEPLRPSSSNGHDVCPGNTGETKCSDNGKSNDKGIQGFSGTTRPATGSWAWRRGRDAPLPAPELKTEVKPPEVKPAKGEEKVYIPSIDDILARLDQEDEEEQAMR